MGAFSVIEVNKSIIQIGDCIVHCGKEVTVGKNDITRCELFGIKIFGDSYRLGRKLVKRMIYRDPR